MTLFRLTSRPRSRLTPSTDWIWGGFGITMAGCSASFAAYMIATAPAQVTGSGSKDWAIFVHYDKRAPALALADGTALPERAAGLTAADPGIDPEPTGSIAFPTAQAATAALQAGSATILPRQARPAGDLPGFFVRNVVGGKALIEHRERLSLVRPGSVLDEAGEVLAIERRGDSWVVKTAAGTIGNGS